MRMEKGTEVTRPPQSPGCPIRLIDMFSSNSRIMSGILVIGLAGPVSTSPG